MKPIFSIIVNCAGRIDEARFGIKSIIDQDLDCEYEIVVQLFGRKWADFGISNDNNNCRLKISEYETAGYFNISAANNLGSLDSDSDRLIFLNADIVYQKYALKNIADNWVSEKIKYGLGTRYNLTGAETRMFYNYAKDSLCAGRKYLENITKEIGKSPFASSPWMFDKNFFFDLGGFNTNLYCYEDREIHERAVHLLREINNDQLIPSYLGLIGYHLDHPVTEVFDSSEISASEYRKTLAAINSKTLKMQFCYDKTRYINLMKQQIPATPKVRSILRRSKIVKKAVKIMRILVSE